MCKEAHTARLRAGKSDDLDEWMETHDVDIKKIAAKSNKKSGNRKERKPGVFHTTMQKARPIILSVACLMVAVWLFSNPFSWKSPLWLNKMRLPDTVTALDSKDGDQLKEVFYGGQPWLIQCSHEWKLEPVVQEALPHLGDTTQVAIMHCDASLPSGKTAFSKFKLSRKINPMMLFAVNGKKPEQVPAAKIKSSYDLLAYIKQKQQPDVIKLTKQKQLDDHCAKNRPCIVVLSNSGSKPIKAIINKHRSTRFLLVQNNVGVSGLPEGSMVALKRPADATGKGMPKELIAMPFTGAADEASMEEFLQKAADGIEKRGGSADDSAKPEDGEAPQAPQAPSAVGFKRIATPKVGVKRKAQKKTAAAPAKTAAGTDNADRQAKRRKLREERDKADEAQRELERQAQEASEAEAQRLREQARREQMAREEERANAAFMAEEEGEEEEGTDEGDKDAEAEEEVEAIDFDEDDEEQI